MKHPKKILKKLIIPSVVLALGLFTLIGAKAGIFNIGNTKPRGGAGNPDADNRGTAENPFVILEVAPSFGSDNIKWNSKNDMSAKWDSMQIMRWGVGEEVKDILTNQDLLHNIAACDALADNGVVTKGAKITGTPISETAYNALPAGEKKYYTEKTDNSTVYKYLRRATNSDSGIKLVMVIEGVSAPGKNNNKVDGFNYKKNNDGDWKYVNVGETRYMVYVKTGGNYTLSSPKDKFVAFHNVENEPFKSMSTKPVLFVAEESVTKPTGKVFDKSVPATGYNDYYYQYQTYEKAHSFLGYSWTTTEYVSEIADEFVAADKIMIKTENKTVKTYTEADHYASLTSTNLFADKVLHKSNPANCVVKVVSVTAQTLNSDTESHLNDGKALVDRADLIIFNANPDKSYGGYGDNNCDLTAKTMMKLYTIASTWKLTPGVDGCPIVMNNSILTKTPGSGTSAKTFNIFKKVDASGYLWAKITNSVGYSNYAYKLALMLHVLNDEEFRELYLEEQLQNPRLDANTYQYVPATRSGRNGTNTDVIGSNDRDSLKNFWNIYTFAPIHETDEKDWDATLAAMANDWGWRSDNSKTVVEDEYWLYATTETDMMKYFFYDYTNAKTSFVDGYTVKRLFEYIYPGDSKATEKKCSPLQIIDFLINKGYDFVPTPSPTPTPSATPTNTPTPYIVPFELHASEHGKVQAGDATKGKDSNYDYTVYWPEHLKMITITCKAEADANSHFVGWYTSDKFEGSPEYTNSTYDKTIQAQAGNKVVLYARFLTNTPTPTATNTPTPTPTPRIESGVRILEVQAYGSYETDWGTKIKNLYDSSTKYSVVDQITVKEFIGRVEDLTDNYDLIYFGLKTNSYFTDWIQKAAKTGGNTTTWTYVYSHVGPLIYHGKNARRGGLLDPNYDRYDNRTTVNGKTYSAFSSSSLRTYLSGNDITNKKYLELKAFMNAGGSIVFASDFLNSKGSFDTTKVDNSSYIYKLYTDIKDKSGFVIYGKQTNTTKTQFKKNHNDKFVSFDMTLQPIGYDEQKANEADRYINGHLDSDRVLKYKFTIEDNASITSPFYYSLGLYVDLNADGRFNSSEAEILKGATIIDKTTNKQLEENQMLQSWHVYEVSRDVSELVGVVPWKIELTRKDTTISTSVTGYSAIKARDDERILIRVLQVHENGGEDTENINGKNNYVTHLLPARADVIKYANDHRTESKFSALSSEISRLNSKINNDPYLTPKFTKAEEETIAKLYDLVSGSNLTSTYVKMHDSKKKEFTFTSSYSTNGIKTTQKYFDLFKNLNEFTVQVDRMSCKVFNEWSKNNKLIDNYDMVILGFSDGYSDLETEAGKNLNDFINAGKSALFAHDTTSHTNIDLTGKLTNDHQWNGDWSWGYNINQMFRARLGMDRFNVKGKNATSYASDPNYVQDKAWANGSNRGSTVEWIQGYNDIEITNSTVTSTRQESTKVQNVNRGAITIYPYYIGERITISNTHIQYYQLDMENPNLVVWYTLASDSTGNVFYKDAGDTQNCYYIYNIGNITYTGAGHDVGDPNSILSELKLFVNTVVSAYRAAGSPVTTYITNDEKTSSENTDYLYIDFDSNDTTMAVGEGIAKYNDKQSKQVTFTVEDNSIIDTEKIEVNYYIQKSNIDMLKKDDLDNPDYWTAINFDTFNINGSGSGKSFGTQITGSNIRTTDGRKYYKVLDRKEYGFYLPLELIEASSSMMIRIQTTITYGSVDNGNLSTITTDKYVEVLRRGFFNLD